MKQKFDIITSTCVPLPLENVDTDQIIPARFLSPLTFGISLMFSSIISFLSVEENIGFLLELSSTPIITLSYSLDARLITSKWPFVIGSKLPGYTAILN